MSHPCRTRFAGEIVTEFLPPKAPSNKVMILAPGMPGMPSATKALYTIQKKGYWGFLPRYRGTWESGGQFLDHSPYDDIIDVVEGVSQPFVSLWDDVEYAIDQPEIYVVGSSFGGPAGMLAAGHPLVQKAVAIAPLVDWRLQKDSPTESMDWLGEKVRQAFGHAYRFSSEDWERLAHGEFYNPVDMMDHIDPTKLLIVHAMDDDVVSYAPTAHIAAQLGCKLISVKKGGHLGSRVLSSWHPGRNIWKFLKT